MPFELVANSQEDVGDVVTGFGQSAADKQVAVAVERIGFGAHRRQSVLLRRLDQPRDAGAKFGLRRHLLVIRSALRV